MDRCENSIKTHPYSQPFKTSSSAQTVSLLSWNIIHPDYSNHQEFPYAKGEDMKWCNRLPKIRNKLSSSNAGIICLQEVSGTAFGKDIGDHFVSKHGYSYKLNKPTKKSKVDFTTAIMYKRDKFECKYEDYRARATILLLTNKLEEAKYSKCKTHPKNMCLYHSFFVVNVHLDAQKRDRDTSVTRMNQIKSILKRINFCITEKLKLSVEKEADHIRIMVVGDCNSGVEEGAANVLLKNDNSHFAHLYKFKEAYHERIMNGNYEWHSLPKDDPNVRVKYFPSYCAHGRVYNIDLLFYTNTSLRLKAVSNTLSDELKEDTDWDKTMSDRIEEWKQLNRKANKNEQYHLADYQNILMLPNDKMPSDHLPIAAIFEFDNLSNEMNAKKEQCRCSSEPIRPKKDKKKKKEKKKQMKNGRNNNAWNFHQISSF